MSGTWDWEIEAGSLFDETRTITDENGDPWDFTDYDPANTPGAIGPRAHLRVGKDEPDPPILSLGYAATPGDEGIAILQPPTSGMLRVVIKADTSAGLSYTPPGTPLETQRVGVQSIEIVPLSEADAVRLTDGSFSIDAEATR